MTKHLLTAAAALIAVSFSSAHAGDLKRPEYTKADEARADALLAKMSVAEKVRQLRSAFPGFGGEIMLDAGTITNKETLKKFGPDNLGTISMPLGNFQPAQGAEAALMIQEVATKHTRNGVPTFITGEALHGLHAVDGACFPQAIAMGATWDIPLMEKIADRIGREASARGVNMVHSPVVDLAREPRHGRFEECYAEDVLLTSRLGVAFVRGVQSYGVICTPKHFVANFVAPGGRDSADIEISEREMRELHLAPYEAVVREGGALGIMSAYNSVNGVPCSANKRLLTDILRDEWGFKGVVVSDWSATDHFYNELHVSGGSARSCLAAGLDIDLPYGSAYGSLAKDVETGRVDMGTLDAAVRRVLLSKAAIGLFEPGHKFADSAEAVKLAADADRRGLPLAVEREAIVLLKNKDKRLPISGAVKRIAVIGPNSDKLRGLRAYTANGTTGPSPLDAIRARFGKNAEILAARGCELVGGEGASGDKSIAAAVETAKKADLCVLVMGGDYLVTGGEGQDRSTLNLMGRQEDLVKAVAATGKPVVVVLITGYPITVANWIDKVDALVCAWHVGSDGNTALAEVLAGDVNPSGHLPVTFPRDIAQLPLTYDMRPCGRGGKYVPLNKSGLHGARYDAQYPFGFGLSYTTFQYSDLKLSSEKISPEGKTSVRVKVTNTGDREGATVTQLYLAANRQRIVPRERILRDFARVSLKPGETKELTFELGPKDFSFLDESLKRVVEPGAFTVTVGEDCLAPLAAKIEITAGKN